MNKLRNGASVSKQRSLIIAWLKARGVTFPNCPKTNILLQVAEVHLGIKTGTSATKRRRLAAIATAVSDRQPLPVARRTVQPASSRTRKFGTPQAYSANDVVIAEGAIKEFYKSYDWRRVRYDILRANNGRCELCGRSKHDGIILNIDHIKPLRLNWHLRLSPLNLQVLCNECNHGKGNRDTTDWRPQRRMTVASASAFAP